MKKSKVTALILAMAMAISLFTIPASAENLTAADALAVLKHVVGTQLLSSEQMTKYGFTDEKAITSADALSILKKVVGTTDTPTSEQTTTPEAIPEYITIKGVQYSTSLDYLNLRGEGLTNDDIKPLQYMVNLTVLDLWANEISDVSPLYSLRNLQMLDLQRNPVSDDAIRELTKNLPGVLIMSDSVFILT
ncbi:MAG: protein phosphatase 1 regulatory subunit 42 [Oscillospiraceae bacterium]|nr:protein phosphatase 1 regulatory subunit 42 [Oscillospiraceae bacterium]